MQRLPLHSQQGWRVRLVLQHMLTMQQWGGTAQPQCPLACRPTGHTAALNFRARPILPRACTSKVLTAQVCGVSKRSVLVLLRSQLLLSLC